MVVLVLGVVFTPTKNTIIMCFVMLGLLVDYIAYRYKEYRDLFKVIRKPFSVDNCTEKQLIKRCDELRLSEENKYLAIEFFIKKTKQKQIADALCINEKSVQIRKKRLRKKLNNM